MKRNGMRKYRNQKVGKYDSHREAQFAAKLEMLKHCSDEAVRVVDVKEQVAFELIPSQRVDGKVVERSCKYIADFVVTRSNGVVDVFDVKGFRTKDYVIKRKLMLHVHGIRVQEV